MSQKQQIKNLFKVSSHSYFVIIPRKFLNKLNIDPKKDQVKVSLAQEKITIEKNKTTNNEVSTNDKRN